MGSQSEILFHEILDVQKILVGLTNFFFLVLKFGRNSLTTDIRDLRCFRSKKNFNSYFNFSSDFSPLGLNPSAYDKKVMFHLRRSLAILRSGHGAQWALLMFYG